MSNIHAHSYRAELADRIENAIGKAVLVHGSRAHGHFMLPVDWKHVIAALRESGAEQQEPSTEGDRIGRCVPVGQPAVSAPSGPVGEYDPATGTCRGACDCSIGQTCKAYLIYAARRDATHSGESKK